MHKLLCSVCRKVFQSRAVRVWGTPQVCPGCAGQRAEARKQERAQVKTSAPSPSPRGGKSGIFARLKFGFSR